MRVWLGEQEITGLCVRTAIDKDINAAGAEAEITLVCAPLDSRLPQVNPGCGQWVTVRDGEEELFFGQAERISYDGGALELTLLCYDPASRLARNHCRGPYLGTKSAIAAQLLRECGLRPGEIWEDGGQETQLAAACGRSAFRAIRSLYGNRCVVDYRRGAVDLRQRGAGRVVVDSRTLVELTARNTVEDACTRMDVYSGGQLAARAEDIPGQSSIGLRHRTQYLSLDYPDAEAQARAGLAGVSRQARLTLTGRSRAMCGQKAALDRAMLGVTGEYLITQVTWINQGGVVTTQLGVESF